MKNKAPKRDTATLRAIAEEAGVTTTTVSCILNNKGGKYAEKTQEKIFEIAKRLKYRPNILASSVRSGKSNSAGVMIPNREWFYQHIINGIHDTLIANDTIMLLSWNDHYSHEPPNDDQNERRIIHRLVDHRVDGIILLPSCETFEASYFEEIWERNLPLVLVDREMSLFAADFVGTDDRNGGRTAAEYLLSLGHRQLAFIGAEALSTSHRREQGFLQVVEGSPDACVDSIDFEHHAAKEAVVELFCRRTHRPTAVFCINDSLAVRVMAIATDLGLSIPDDLSFVGFGDQRLNQTGHPLITTFDQHPTRIGAAAAERYLQRVRGTCDDEIVQIQIKPELVIGSTTASCTAG